MSYLHHKINFLSNLLSKLLKNTLLETQKNLIFQQNGVVLDLENIRNFININHNGKIT
jgi:hypothetical protein